jgi:predicted DNA-binding transcriptional regulator
MKEYFQKQLKNIFGLKKFDFIIYNILFFKKEIISNDIHKSWSIIWPISIFKYILFSIIRNIVNNITALLTQIDPLLSDW